MNVLFVDIDGVLNTLYSSEIIIEEKVKILKELCNLFDAKVVIESSHKPIYYFDSNSYFFEKENNKYFDIMLEEERIESKVITELYELFNKYDIELIGFTPSIELKEQSKSLYVYKDFEITYFLMNHPEIEHFCILDDNDSTDLTLLSNYLVEVDDKVGLTLDLSKKIEDVLAKENPFKSIIKDELQRKVLSRKKNN